MSFAVQIVCVLAVLCGALGAPAVTYDRRQNGDFNLQVEVDGMSIVLMPGIEFERSNAFGDGNNKAKLAFGRRSGLDSRKKHKKPVNCTAAATGSTEKPETPSYTVSGGGNGGFATSSQGYGGVPTSSQGYGEVPTSSQGYEEVPSSGQEKSDASNVPTNVDSRKTVSDDHILSVTPSAPTNSVDAGVTTATVVQRADTATGTVETAVVPKAVEKSTDPTVSNDAVADVKPVETAVSAGFGEKNLLSVPSEYHVKTVDGGTVKTAADEHVTATSAVKTADKSEPVGPQVGDEFGEMVAMKTLERAGDKKTAESVEKSAGAAYSIRAQQLGPDVIGNDSVEMVAMKTLEKPTYAEVLNAVKNPAEADAAETAATVVEIGKTPSFDSNESPSDVVATKTAEKLPSAEALNVDQKPADSSGEAKTGATADTKKTATTESHNNPTEMIAVKTMEKPSSAEALKVDQKPADAPGALKTGAAEDTGKTASIDSNKNLTEMVAMKTVDKKQSNAARPVDAEGKTEITTSTKLVEIQEDKKTSSKPIETTSLKSAPKPVEMVAVKTMDNPTITSVKSVISVKTTIKPGTLKTALSTNGSSILRKVGDRKPLPSVTLEVTPPKIV